MRSEKFKRLRVDVKLLGLDALQIKVQDESKKVVFLEVIPLNLGYDIDTNVDEMPKKGDD